MRRRCGRWCGRFAAGSRDAGPDGCARLVERPAWNRDGKRPGCCSGGRCERLVEWRSVSGPLQPEAWRRPSSRRQASSGVAKRRQASPGVAGRRHDSPSAAVRASPRRVGGRARWRCGRSSAIPAAPRTQGATRENCIHHDLKPRSRRQCCSAPPWARDEPTRDRCNWLPCAAGRSPWSASVGTGAWVETRGSGASRSRIVVMGLPQVPRGPGRGGPSSRSRTMKGTSIGNTVPP